VGFEREKPTVRMGDEKGRGRMGREVGL